MESVYADMTGPEKEVAKHLKRLGLWWQYEAPVFVYDEKGRPRVWTPDFYIPKLGMYVEVCGSQKHDYTYRETIFIKNGFPVIFVETYKEADRWKNYLVAKIKEIEDRRHDEVMKMIGSRIT